MPIPARTPPGPRTAIFYTGHGYALCDLATDQELDAGPFNSLHSAWRAADGLGLIVTDVWATRRTAKHRARRLEGVA